MPNTFCEFIFKKTNNEIFTFPQFSNRSEQNDDLSDFNKISFSWKCAEISLKTIFFFQTENSSNFLKSIKTIQICNNYWKFRKKSKFDSKRNGKFPYFQSPNGIQFWDVIYDRTKKSYFGQKISSKPINFSFLQMKNSKYLLNVFKPLKILFLFR